MSVTSHSKFTLLKTNPGNHLYTQCLALKFTTFLQRNKEFHLYSVYKECISTNLWLVDFSFRLVNVMHHLPIGSLAPLGKWAFFLSRDIKQRQAARTPCVVFVIASHYQSLRIIVLLLQTCLLGSEVLSPTLLLQQLHMHRLQQDRRFRLFASLVSCFLKTDSVASFLRETVEMFSQILFRWKDGLATFLYCNFCGLGSSLHCSSWPFIKVMWANQVSAFSIQIRG